MNEPTPIEPSMDAATRQQIVSARTPVPTKIGVDLDRESPTSDVTDVIAAEWRRNNLLGALSTYMNVDDSVETGWNVYSYFKRHEKEYEDIAPFVRRGDLDDVFSEEAFHSRVQLLRQQMRDMEIIQNGGVLGAVAGVGVALLDPTNYIPVLGPAARFGRAANAARTAAGFGAGVAVQEGVLHQLQPTRTGEETAWAVGGAAAMGAGFGALVGRRAPALAENETAIARPGESLDGEALVLNRDSIGAARRNAEDLKLARSDNEFLAKVQDGIGKVFDHWSPLARVWHWPSDKGREIILSTIDTLGRLTRGNLEGRAQTNIETLNAVDRQFLAGTQERIMDLYRQVNLDMGQSAAGTNLRTWAAKMTPGMSKDLNRVEIKTFTDGVSRLLAARITNDVRARRDLLESIQGRGFAPEQAETVVRRMEQAVGEVTKFWDHYKQKAIREGLLDPKNDLGDAYGMPIMFLKESVDRDPNGFRAILVDMLAENPPQEFLEQFAKSQQIEEAPGKFRPMTVEELLADRDRLLAAKLEWRGEQEDLAKARAAENLQAAQAALDRSLAELEVILHGQRVVEREKRVANIAQAKAQVLAAEASYFARKLEAAVRRLDAAEARIAEFRKNYPDVFELADDVLAEFRKSGDALDAVVARVADRVAAQREAQANTRSVREDLKALREELGDDVADLKAREALRQAREALTEALKEQKAATLAVREARAELAQAARESRNANRWLDAVAKRIDQHSDDMADAPLAAGMRESLEMQKARLDRAKELLAEAQAARRAAFDEGRVLRTAGAISRREVRAALKERNKAKRLDAKLRKMTPLQQYVDDLVDRIRGGQDSIPDAILLDQDKTSGRLKERKLPWTTDTLRAAMAGGFIESDLFQMMNRYHTDLSGKVNMKRVLGTTNIGELLDEIRADYDRLLDVQRRAGNVKAVAQLLKMRDKNLDDARTVLEKALGQTRIGSVGDETAVRWADRLRTAVYLGAAGGFVFSALTDSATGMLLASAALPGLIRHANTYSKLVKLARKNDPDAVWMRSILHSLEANMHLPSESALMAELAPRAGLNLRDPRLQGAGDKVDAWMKTAADRVNVLSGLATWTDLVRRTTALALLDGLARKTMVYDSLSKAEKANWASLGISSADAKRLGALFKKYGREVNGVWTPGTSKWHLEPDGDAMREVLESALVLAQRRGSFVNSYGAVPNLMGKWWGALLLQFQTYAFNFTQAFILSGTQRMLTTGDLRPAMALGALLGATVLTSVLRAEIRGEDTDNWDQTKWAWEIVNRSGMLGYLSPYTDAGIKVFGDDVNEALGVKLFEPSSRFRQNTATQSLFGPSLSFVERPVRALNYIAEGDYEKSWDTASTMIPLNQTFRALSIIPKEAFE